MCFCQCHSGRAGTPSSCGETSGEPSALSVVSLSEVNCKHTCRRVESGSNVVKGILQSERFTVLTYICILYWLCLVIVHRDR